MNRNDLIIAFVLINWMACCCFASGLSVGKSLKGGPLSTVDASGNVTVLLNFSNPFGRPLQARIVDSVIVGDNGVEITCLDVSLPADRNAVLEYEPITPNKPGNYSIPPAVVTYTNPETGRSENVSSNPLQIEVTGVVNQNLLTQSVTEIYRCDGVNMQSTSMRTVSQQSTGSSGQSGEEQQQQEPATEEQMSRQQDMVQNNQLNQDMNSLKQDIERQKTEREEMMEAFKETVQQNNELGSMDEELQKQGFKPVESSLDPVTNDSGDFNLTYQTEEGLNASLSGSIEDGEVKKLDYSNQAEADKALEALYQDPEYQRLRDSLEKQGLTPGEPVVSQSGPQNAKVSVPYFNETLGREVNITAQYVNETITEVRLQESSDGKGPDWTFIIPLLLLILALGLVYRFRSNGINGAETQEPAYRERDLVAEARELLKEAEELHARGEVKNSFEKVSRAVRLYYMHDFGTLGELTATEVVRLLQAASVKDVDDMKRCLELCTLVEFARYQPSGDEFREVLGIAKRIIG